MFQGSIKPALVDIDRATEFTGDDVDRFSELVDLDSFFKDVEVTIPALDASGVVSMYKQNDGAVDTIPVQVQSFDMDGTGHFAKATSSDAGSISITFTDVNTQYLRLHVAGNQAADITFYVRGC